MCLIASTIAASCADATRPLTLAERVSLTTSLVSVSDTITTEGSVVLLTLKTRDAAGDSLTSGGLAVEFTAYGGTTNGTIGPVADKGDGTYSASFSAVSPGTPVTIGASIGGAPVTSVLPTVEVTVAMADVSPGYSATCGVTAGGDVYCWGYNGNGAFGDGTTISSATPVPGPTGLGFRSVAVGGSSACGVTGVTAYCWGSGIPRGIIYPISSTTPVQVTAGPFEAVSPSFSHTCGLATGGTAWCWGINYEGRLGNGLADGSAYPPVAVVGGLTFRMVVTGGKHACGVTTAGAAWCWGSNYEGQLGDGTQFPSASPVPVLGGLSFQSIGPGGHFTCGVTTGGDAYCWGWNAGGALGNGGSGGFFEEPVQVVGGHAWASVRPGYWHACGVTTEGEAYCWGYNDHGQLGDGTTTDSPTPVPVAGGHTFRSVTGGADYTCGVTTNGAVYCWGNNADGNLGDGTTTDRHTPVLIPIR